MFRERGVRATAFLASEYGVETVPIDEGTLVVDVTQSGGTADALRPFRTANDASPRSVGGCRHR